MGVHRNSLLQPYPAEPRGRRRAVVFFDGRSHWLVGSDAFVRRYESFPCNDLADFNEIIFYPYGYVDVGCTLERVATTGVVGVAASLQFVESLLSDIEFYVEADYPVVLQGSWAGGLAASCQAASCSALVELRDGSVLLGGDLRPRGGLAARVPGSGVDMVINVTGPGDGVRVTGVGVRAAGYIDVDGTAVEAENAQDVILDLYARGSPPLRLVGSTRVSLRGTYLGGQALIENSRLLMHASFEHTPQTTSAYAAGVVYIVNATEFSWNGKFTGVACVGPGFNCRIIQ